jgi:cytoskeletal protein RodZ
MKIQRKKSFFTRTRIVIIAAVLILAAVGAAFWWFFMRSTPTVSDQRPANSVDYGPATDENKQDSADAKQNAVDQQENPSTVPTPTSDSLIVTINRAGQAAAGQQVAVRTQIDGAKSGTCEMTFTKGSSTFTKTFTMAADVSTIICNGDVAASDFASGGEWDLSIVAKSSGVASKPATQKVTVQK